MSSPSSPLDSKPCPRCSKPIKADALLCRFCGYRLDSAALTGPTSVADPLVNRPGRLEDPGRSPAGPGKNCPACGESVQATARICRFCGYAFDREFAAANPSFVRLSGSPPRPRIFTRRWFFFRVLLPLLFIGLILLYVVSQLAGQLHYLTPDNPHPSAATPSVLVLDSYVG